jgi:predicted Zn-dependent protease
MGVALAACATVPATGKPALTGLLSTAEEIRIGREQRPEVLKAFGGYYRDAKLQAYVSEVGQKLARGAERRDITYTFTVLNSPITNALTTPAGYIYITRGILALADNEAELATVLGHEMGHVTALHHAQRYSRAVMAQLGLSVLGAVTGIPAAVQGAQLGALVFLQSFSRQEEYEADGLAARYMARAGYDPMATVTLLRKMEAYTRLQAMIQGRAAGTPSPFDYLATHPTTAERMRQALAEAKSRAVEHPVVNRDAYLSEIDGMLYGEPSSQGYIRERVYEHRQLRVRFEVPPGFQLFDTERYVYATGPGRTLIVFDTDQQQQLPTDYIAKVWAPGLRISDVRQLRVAGLKAASAFASLRTNRGPLNMILVAIAGDGIVYRFRFATPSLATAPLNTAARNTLESFQILSRDQAGALKPMRIRVVMVKRGETIADFARRMAFDNYKTERFLVLNGLSAGQELTPGMRVKLVTR